MKKVLSFFLVLTLAACGQEEVETGGQSEQVEPIEVELLVPETVEVGTETVFESIVTQGDEGVDDASEVVYEIWVEGNKEESEMIEAGEQNGEHYILSHQFDEAGMYHVQAHVTARGLHRMPSTVIQVVDLTEEQAEHTSEKMSEHHHGEVNAEFSENGFTILLEEQPFKNGQVTLELYEKGDESSPLWIDLKEVEEGLYSLPDDFSLKGPYRVTLHLVSENVHEHHEMEIDIS